jgi:hypothetical protein
MLPTIRVFLASLLTMLAPIALAKASVPLYATRTSPTDLEIGGEITGVPHGEIRFVHYADLLHLPQQSVIANNDTNFGKPVHISGILLEDLPALLGASPQAQMITALCDDLYKANYPADYLKTHHPILVLTIEGQPPTLWPKAIDGPYIITHADFTPTFHILAHADEPQIPWGVVRLDFRREAEVYAGIQPRDPATQQGYTIARQNCFRCHNEGAEGGTKAGLTWEAIARFSATAPEFFDSYVRDPKKVNPAAHMDGSPGYDDATLNALHAYFKPFAEVPK